MQLELKAEIDQTPNATDEERQQKRKSMTVTTAKNAIDQATNNNGVTLRKQTCRCD